MRPFDLSLRYKLPLWGSLLIIVTAVALSLSFMVQAYEDLRRDMLANSESLGRTLVRTLQPAILHDDVWRAFEILRAPYRDAARASAFQAEDLIVLDDKSRVFVSTRPETYPMLTEAQYLHADFGALKAALEAKPGETARSVALPKLDKLLVVLPIVVDGVRIGSLVMVHPADFYWPRFQALAGRATLITLLALAVLLPLNWYWGQRMTVPLRQLADRMDEVGEDLPPPLGKNLYRYRDELGRLFLSFDRMLSELREKKALEAQMVRSERLAALGRLSASVAHEINNPLGGLMTAVDTLRQHAAPDPISARVLPLLERGLRQIKEIVAALLVEARTQNRPLTRQELEDVHTLLAQEASKQSVDWVWQNDFTGEAPLPAGLVRQVLMNLVANAIRAAGELGRVGTRLGVERGELHIAVENDGKGIPPELMNRLYEPFTSHSEGGHGLGLWVTYQIVQQLKGRIEAESHDGLTRFRVALPLEPSA
ncbi:signal transduction histidine kinase [Sulfuritortus calidifontis]|uniref:histidine kinase n=1 Tax=Sulfuritortus calidifontis TaxID=1914471 RepID=A0A4R3JV73_9PROT|nr:HAMP domain-containing sensor histidine kinase [Sulfuritortus calidifontis]TCS71759.1 signal transduction histidine kinase [Sulfuritortus calidifontis]